jgi:hypothetical protein
MIPNLLQAPSQALPLVRGRAEIAPPLTRGGWEGFEKAESYVKNCFNYRWQGIANE